MTAILSVNSLCRSFGGLQVTRNVDLQLQVGARTALIGPNGAGKSTLVNLIAGSLKPTSGSVHFDGVDITQASQSIRATGGLVRTFQVTRLFHKLTVADNVRLALLQRLCISGKWWSRVSSVPGLDDETDSVLESLNLSDRAARRVADLAYGEQRLVEMALALALKPKVLLLDEPAAGVPKGESEVILDALKKLPDSMAILLIEHDMDLVFRFARDIVVLVSGAVMTTGTPEEVSSNEDVRRLYLGAA